MQKLKFRMLQYITKIITPRLGKATSSLASTSYTTSSTSVAWTWGYCDALHCKPFQARRLLIITTKFSNLTNFLSLDTWYKKWGRRSPSDSLNPKICWFLLCNNKGNSLWNMCLGQWATFQRGTSRHIYLKILYYYIFSFQTYNFFPL